MIQSLFIGVLQAKKEGVFILSQLHDREDCWQIRRILKKTVLIFPSAKMASATQQKVDIKMSRFDNAPWGFRVHGGIDFGSPLTIQKVRQMNDKIPRNWFDLKIESNPIFVYLTSLQKKIREIEMRIWHDRY